MLSEHDFLLEITVTKYRTNYILFSNKLFLFLSNGIMQCSYYVKAPRVVPSKIFPVHCVSLVENSDENGRTDLPK